MGRWTYGARYKAGIDFAAMYGKYWQLSNRRWQMRGVKFSSLSSGLQDCETMVAAFDECRHGPMPSSLAMTYLLYSQTRVLKRLLFQSSSTWADKLYGGRRAEQVYDLLMAKSLAIPAKLLNAKGELKKNFCQRPATHIDNCHLRAIKDILSDRNRFATDKAAGRKASMRKIDRQVWEEQAFSLEGLMNMDTEMVLVDAYPRPDQCAALVEWVEPRHGTRCQALEADKDQWADLVFPQGYCELSAKRGDLLWGD